MSTHTHKLLVYGLNQFKFETRTRNIIHSLTLKIKNKNIKNFFSKNKVRRVYNRIALNCTRKINTIHQQKCKKNHILFLFVYTLYCA